MSEPPTLVGILFNDDQTLVAGEERDRLAVEGVDAVAATVAAAVRAAGWSEWRLAVGRDLQPVLDRLREQRPDVVFNLVESVAGQPRMEAAMAWVLEWLELPYTGSPPEAMSAGLDKAHAKALLQAAGVPVPGLSFPAIIKPRCQDASHGISPDSVVADEAAAEARIAYVRARYLQEAVVEEFIEGREFNLSLVGPSDRPTLLPPSEIDFREFTPGRPRVVGFEAKWSEGSADFRGTTPFFPELPPPTLEALRSVATKAYEAIGLRDYGRVDVRFHESRGPFVVDVNPNPDLSTDAGLARAAARTGLVYDELVQKIVRMALARAGVASPPHEISDLAGTPG
ncbi:MAG TPA: D-alanine--D-alanine ligase [Candidatus Dormibacteraeota bacterium]